MAGGMDKATPLESLVPNARMLPANPFVRQATKPRMPRVYDPSQDRIHDRVANLINPTNTAVREVIGHPKFGYQTILSSVNAPLPTSPAIVGGNTDWTRSRSSPATHFLHSQLRTSRPMMPVDALGTLTRLAEPNGNSIHTSY